MTEYETLLSARRLLATVEAGRAACLSLAAAYLPLRSAALLRESFQDSAGESSMWPEAAVERRLAIERLRRASPGRHHAGEGGERPAPREVVANAPAQGGPQDTLTPAVRGPRAAPVLEKIVVEVSAPIARAPVAEPPQVTQLDVVPVVVAQAPVQPARASLPPESEPTREPTRVRGTTLPPLPAAPPALFVPPANTAGAPDAQDLAPVEVAPSRRVDLRPEVIPEATPFEFDVDAPAEGAVARPAEGAAAERVRVGRPNKRLVPDDMLSGLQKPNSKVPAPVLTGLAARLGGLARQPDPSLAAPTSSNPPSDPSDTFRAAAETQPPTLVTDRRRDERITRRIAFGPAGVVERPGVARRLGLPVVEPVAAVVAPEPVVSEEPVVEAPAVEPDAAAVVPASPEVEVEDTASQQPGAALRSLAAALGTVGLSPRGSLPPLSPSLPMAPMLPPVAPVPVAAPPDPSDMEGPYITLESPVVREASRPTAAVDVRAAARIGSAAGGDEPLALEGREGVAEDTTDDDSTDGMRVHFEVAAPSRAAPTLSAPPNRLSFDDDDLTIVQGVNDTRDAKPVPKVVDHNARRVSEEAKLTQFLDGARQHSDRGEYQKAIQGFTDALDFKPSHSDAYIGRGRCHMELGHYTSAMSDFRRAEDQRPRHPDPQVAMGDLYYARKEYKRAIEFYDQAVELDGEHAMARCRRGISHYYRKNYRQAYQDLKRAEELDREIANIKKYVQMALKKMEKAD